MDGLFRRTRTRSISTPARSASTPAPAREGTPSSSSSSLPIPAWYPFPFANVQPAMLYPLPNVRPTNMVKLKHKGDIGGTWAICSTMTIPIDSNALHLSDESDETLASGARATVELDSQDGGIVAKLYIIPSASFPTAEAATIRMNTGGGDIKLTILDSQIQNQGLVGTFRTHRQPLHIECTAGGEGNVSVALPRSFRGSILLGRRVRYLTDTNKNFVCDYSAAVKEQLSITTADDEEHCGFIGAPSARDRLEVDCHGRIYICYEHEEVGPPDEECVLCVNQ